MGTQFTPTVGETSVLTEKQTPKLKRPSLYRVLLLNDDYTPMDFVVVVLQLFFGMSYSHAIQVMFDVHHHGKGVCGAYTRDIAQTKVAQVNKFARENEQPLLCIMEKCDS